MRHAVSRHRVWGRTLPRAESLTAASVGMLSRVWAVLEPTGRTCCHLFCLCSCFPPELVGTEGW